MNRVAGDERRPRPFVPAAGRGQSPWARFDDLIAGRARCFASPYRVLTATTAAQVEPVLAEVDTATRAGSWAFGYVAYEAAPGLDSALSVAPADPDGLPLVWFGLTGPPVDVPVVARPTGPTDDQPRWTSAWSDGQHRAGVLRVREHIAAGDIFQCNLTVRLHGDAPADPEGLYAELAHNQRAAHAAYLDLDRFVLAGASPELFFSWRGDELLTRPMKGTAPRGRTPEEDRQRLVELTSSPKERAENIIVVDLLRNDVGRIADLGTVTTPALCVPERYETVWQLTSDVVGRVPAGTPLVEVFRALFPSGSVTGAPKPRAMDIIRSVEATPRGVYCGAVGWVAPPGSDERAHFDVAIRTAVVDREAGTLVYGSGGGITWGSEPSAELAEVSTKATVLRRRRRDFDLLETMHWSPEAGLRSVDRHLARLAASADHVGFPLDLDRLRRELSVAVTGAPASRVRVLLSRQGAIGVELGTLPPALDRPVLLEIDPDPVDPDDDTLFHKTTDREVYRMRARRHPEADDVVLVNTRDEVTETTIANLAVRLDGVWRTPRWDCGLLPGVERGRLLTRGDLQEAVLTPDDLRRAEALAVVSSLRGWRPAALAVS